MHSSVARTILQIRKWRLREDKASTELELGRALSVSTAPTLVKGYMLLHPSIPRSFITTPVPNGEQSTKWTGVSRECEGVT